MVLPKAVAAVFFVPWAFVGIVNNLPTDLRLRIQKSELLQQGTRMKVMKVEPPQVRGVRLIPEVKAIAGSFKKEYAQKDLEILWAALLKCYGSKELALAAVQSEPKMLNPSYSFCNTMIASKAALTGMMSEDEALEIMNLNPAVLQCGPSLAALGPGEIKSFAGLRSLSNKLSEEARTLALATFGAVTVFPVLLAQNPSVDPDLLNSAESVVGAVGAPLFFLAILYLLRAGGLAGGE